MAKTLNQVITSRLTAFNLNMSDGLIDYVTDEVVQHVLNFTAQAKLPKELYSLVAKMVTEFAEPKADPEADTSVNPLANVKSLKVGDITVDLSGGSTTAKAKDVDTDLQKVMQDYESQLVAFRKLRW